MPDSQPTRPGILDSARRLFGHSAAVLRNRVELFAVELQEEKHRQVEVFILAGAALVLGLVGLLLFTSVVVFLFDARYRLYVAAVLGIFYFTGTMLLLARARNRLQSQPFSETIGQIKKDVECLTPPK
jgi:uncharacterized membrane protein YqjE